MAEAVGFFPVESSGGTSVVGSEVGVSEKGAASSSVKLASMTGLLTEASLLLSSWLHAFDARARKTIIDETRMVKK